ncbi:MAG: Flp pilus assembly protein CpaB [Pseudomonadota bacterium]
MRIVFVLVFLFGIGIAGFAAYMAMDQFRSLQTENRVLRQKASLVVETVPVFLATRELRYGQELQEGDVREALFPADAIPENAFTSLEDLFGNEDAEPREIVRTMEPGEVVMATKVTRFGQDATVASRLNKGMRAFTITVDVSTGVSGFLQPGDSVDVYWSGTQQGEQVTRLLLEGIDLIAIDQIADQDTSRPVVARTVTLEVSPIVVAQLAQAQNSGRLTLSLRGVSEEGVLGPLVVTQQDLLGIEEVVEEEKRKCFNRIRRGLSIEIIEVPCVEN